MLGTAALEGTQGSKRTMIPVVIGLWGNIFYTGKIVEKLVSVEDTPSALLRGGRGLIVSCGESDSPSSVEAPLAIVLPGPPVSLPKSAADSEAASRSSDYRRISESPR